MKRLFRYIYYKIISIKDYLISLKISNKKSIKDKFTIIYKSKYWSDPCSERSVSGYGSVSLATENIIKELSIFIDTNNINSILDIPCGDFSWMKEIEMDQINYLGADIIEDLVENNKIKYSSNNIKFCELDIIKVPSILIVC